MARASIVGNIRCRWWRTGTRYRPASFAAARTSLQRIPSFTAPLEARRRRAMVTPAGAADEGRWLEFARVIGNLTGQVRALAEMCDRIRTRHRTATELTTAPAAGNLHGSTARDRNRKQRRPPRVQCIGGEEHNSRSPNEPIKLQAMEPSLQARSRSQT